MVTKIDPNVSQKRVVIAPQILVQSKSSGGGVSVEIRKQLNDTALRKKIKRA